MAHFRGSKVFLLVLLSATLNYRAGSQITDVMSTTSTPIPGAGHNYLYGLNETVNPGNGSVSLKIDLGLPAGRLLSPSAALVYNSNGYRHLESLPYAGWAGDRGLLQYDGWGITLPVASVLWVTLTNPQFPQFTCGYATGYVFTDFSGERHNLHMSWVPPNQAGCIYIPPPIASRTYGFDDVVSATGTAFDFTVSTPDGTRYRFQIPGGIASPGVHSDVPMNIEDRNGNKITTTLTGDPGLPGGASITDTLGRTALSIDHFPYQSHSTNLTVSGIATPFKMNWAAATVNTAGFPVNATPVNPNPCTGNIQSVISTSHLPLQSIALPNGKTYQFAYESTLGLLSQVTYPSGAIVSYTWGSPDTNTEFLEFATTTDIPPGSQICDIRYSTPVIKKRMVKFDGVHVALEEDFSYSATWDGTQQWKWTQKQTTVVTKDCTRASSCSVAPSFTTIYTYSPTYDIDEVGFQGCTGWCSHYPHYTPLEHTIEYHDWNGALLQTTTKTFASLHALQSEQTTLANGQVSETDYGYHQPFFQLAERDNYDWGTPGKGPLLQKTMYSYGDFSQWLIYDAITQATIFDGQGTLVSQTNYSYDETAMSPTSATQHDDTAYGTSFQTGRRNLTSLVACLLVNGLCSAASPTTRFTYDITGHVLSKTDPCGNGTCGDINGANHTTTYSYADSYSSGSPPGSTNAYLTKNTDPLGNFASYTYGYDDGQITSSTDQNSQTTSYTYNTPPSDCASPDGLDRLSKIDYPNTGKTTYCYNDAAPSPTVTTTKVISATPTPISVSATVAMDGIGHIVQTALTTDPDGTTYTVKTYDGLGETYQSWNSTRCSPPTTSCGETTWGLATYTYDALKRVTVVQQPDGSQVQTNYAGNQTTVTDEAGRKRTSQRDGLGRVIAVWEDPGTAPHLNYKTEYQYNALDALVCAVQKGTDTSPFSNCVSAPASWHPRSLRYDALSRLTSATNPESGTITYNYDNNGNLSSKVAPLPNVSSGTVTTNYQYDVLNRLTGKTYSGMAMPNLLYGYDGSTPTGCLPAPPSLTDTYKVGRRTWMCDGSGATSWSHDQMGRVVSQSQVQTIIGGTNVTKSASYGYNLDGSLKTLTYPSGNVVNHTIGTAGRVIQVNDSNNNYVGYSGNSATYTPGGALATLTNGHTGSFAGIVTSNSYNTRLQPAVLAVDNPTQTILNLSYGFNPGNNNGNVQQIVNNLDSARSAVFTYDSLNRISQANTITTTGTKCWGETYTIDAWGNLTNIGGPPDMTGCNTEGPNNPVSANNRVTGWCYDGAGNLLDMGSCDTQTHSFVYDAEGHLQSPPAVTTSLGTLANTYYYDGDGNRVQKCNANPCTSGSATGTLYWLGIGGEVLDESNRAGTVQAEYIYFNGQRIARRDLPTGNIHYYFSNHLGSASVVTDSNGTVQQQTDYYPYGGIAYSTGIDANRYKFTGKERDGESGLDYFVTRYLRSSLGRFMQPDSANIGGELDKANDPQSWNAYAYARNNPELYTDADGMNYLVCDFQGKNCADLSDAQYDQWTKDNPSVQVSASGTISIVNENGSTTDVGQESWYNEKDVQAAGMLARTGATLSDPRTIAAFYAASAIAGYGLFELGAYEGGVTTLEIGAEGAEVTPTTGQAAQIARQLVEHGKKSVQKTLRSLEKRLAEHEAKIQAATKAGGHTSSMVTEVNNYKGLIQAAKNALSALE